MLNFNDFSKNIKRGVTVLAKDTFNGFTSEAIQDSKTFLKGIEGDIKEWSKLCLDGKLSREELEWLLKGKKDLMELLALKGAGLALIKLDRFKVGLRNLVVDSLFSLLKG